MGRQPRPCCRCPKWKSGECLVRGVRRVATAPSCEYGRAKMNSAYQVKWFRNKRRKQGGRVK